MMLSLFFIGTLAGGASALPEALERLSTCVRELEANKDSYLSALPQGFLQADRKLAWMLQGALVQKENLKHLALQWGGSPSLAERHLIENAVVGCQQLTASLRTRFQWFVAFTGTLGTFLFYLPVALWGSWPRRVSPPDPVPSAEPEPLARVDRYR